MALLGRLPRPKLYVCRRCIAQRAVKLSTSSRRSGGHWAAPNPDHAEYWKLQAGRIRDGSQKSMLQILEERGFVKDVAGGREALDWLLTEKPVGVYVGVDPTAPSLHVGHLLPLMALYWMYLHGFPTVSLLGGATVEIGDPSGRTTARNPQERVIKEMNRQSMHKQLSRLWTHVKALGIKHGHPAEVGRDRYLLSNWAWHKDVSALELVGTLGAGMRLGAMLNRDSVRTRMENGNGMALSEFLYPLFQGYDWWRMWRQLGVQVQLGGSDQYGNICAGMEAVNIMRKAQGKGKELDIEDPLQATFGITTPLLTTASGEKFGKSAGNAVWLDPVMMTSYDLYKYFLGIADDDVERYLKLFTFLSIPDISMVMKAQAKDPSKRVAQHLLAKEVVELAHGAFAAKEAEQAHKNAFTSGGNFYHLGVLRTTLSLHAEKSDKPPKEEFESQLVEYKKQFASSAGRSSAAITDEAWKAPTHDNVVTMPLTLIENARFPQLLYASGLVSSKSEGHRLIKSKGAYVVLPKSGTTEQPFHLKWEQIPEGADPKAFLVDFEAVVLRSGKSNIRICRVIPTEQFEAKKLSVPGWEELKSKLADASNDLATDVVT